MRAILATIVLAGCASPPMVETRTLFVISELEIPPVDERFAPGFDLDGVDSDGTGGACTEAVDFTSPVSGAVGVDNQLAAGRLLSVLGTGTYGDHFREIVATGQRVLVLEVSSLGLTDDPEAHVRLFFADFVATGSCDGATQVCPAGSLCPPDASVAHPAACGPITEAAVASSVGLVLPDQQVIEVEPIADAPASIRGGRLVAELDVFPLAFAGDGRRAEIPIRRVRLEGSVSEDGFSDAEIGGRVVIDELVLLINGDSLGGTTVDESAIRAVVEADLDPGATGECDALSAGLSFAAVRSWPAPL